MRHTHFPLEESFRLWDTIEEQSEACAFLDAAAQNCTDLLYDRVQESLALVRVFATLRHQALPDTERVRCEKMAADHKIETLLSDETITLALMGTRGVQESWNYRAQSRDHLCIPLVSSEYVESIPMIASLMKDMGIGLEWLDTKDTHIVVHNRGRSAGMFYVEDALTSVDNKGRKIVPCQAFVREHQLKTVFGVGGAYPDGTFIAIVFFTRDALTRLDIERFLPLVHALKAGTMSVVTGGRFFQAAEAISAAAV